MSALIPEQLDGARFEVTDAPTPEEHEAELARLDREADDQRREEWEQQRAEDEKELELERMWDLSRGWGNRP